MAAADESRNTIDGREDRDAAPSAPTSPPGAVLPPPPAATAGRPADVDPDADRAPTKVCANCGATMAAGAFWCPACNQRDTRPAAAGQALLSSQRLPTEAVVALAAAAVVVVVVVIAFVAWPRGHTLRGTVEVDGSVYLPGSSCSAPGGIRPGAMVTVADATGKPVATGALGPAESGSGFRCALRFEVSGVSPSDSYWVTIGTRSPKSYTRQELDRSGWTVTVTA